MWDKRTPAQENGQGANRKKGIRAVSTFTLLVFLLTELARAESLPPGTPAVKQRSEPLAVESVTIPEAWGRIQESYRGRDSSPAVVLIQDAHAVPEAQRNIQKIIDYLQRNHGLRWVALEGASGELAPQIFKSFPDKETLKKTFDRYFEDGELTGGAAAAIFNQEGGRYDWIEEWNLY